MNESSTAAAAALSTKADREASWRAEMPNAPTPKHAELAVLLLDARDAINNAAALTRQLAPDNELAQRFARQAQTAVRELRVRMENLTTEKHGATRVFFPPNLSEEGSK
jgi:hypothetical protein